MKMLNAREGRLARLEKEGGIYIGRPSIFGNPFKRAGHREDNIRQYKRYFWDRINSDADFLDAVLSLEGKDLICWCAPKPCHGNVILAWFAAGKPQRSN